MLLLGVALVGLFSLPMILKQSTRPWALKINDTLVERGYFEDMVAQQQERLSYFRAQYGQFADMLLQSFGMSNDPRKLATDTIIKQALLSDYAESLKLKASSTLTLEKINNQDFSQKYLADSVPAFLYDADGRINQNIVKIFLQKRSMSSDVFLDMVSSGLSRHVVSALIRASSYTPKHEYTLFQNARYGKKELKIVHLSEQEFFDRAKAEKVDVTVLENFYNEKNRTSQAYYVPERRSAVVWKFSPEDYVANFDQKEIEAYYAEHKNQKFVEKQSTVVVRQIVYTMEEVQNRPSIATLQEELLLNTEKFSEYAKKYSQDESAKNGGLIAPLVYGEKNNSVYKAAFALKKIGDVSPVIPTENGFVILQLVERTAKSYKPLSVVKKSIESILSKEKFNESLSKDIKTVLKDGAIDEQELKLLLGMYNPKQVQAKDLTLKSKEQYVKSLFGLQNNGDATFSMFGNTGFLIKLTGKAEKFLPPFVDVQKDVENDWYILQGAQLLQKTYNNFQALLKETALESVAQKFNLAVETVFLDEHAEKDKKTTSILEKKGIHLQELMDIEKEGSLLSAMNKKGACFVYCASCVLPHDLQLKLEDKTNLSQQFEHAVLEGMIASLHRTATIKVNESFNIPIEDYFV